MYQDIRELENFRRESNKYNSMENMMKLVEKLANSGSGWDIEWSKNRVSVFYRFIWRYFDHPESAIARRERADIEPERSFHQ